ncbi:F0F1 ATP synthase subunit delta [Anaerosalibacter sp. Marseille-P3206]|uniref:F0F1 ATP synthase subunit delta n=1 Tax=Anaerosalibacter sp. Marseille-P3206 TaxID=1871005 RepID=UPI000984B480|nr:F0F1 ATP synthase subunit delta [Anaerosalibacter sp. Marseille-P3206]
MAKLVSKRYALALFETGLELEKLEQFKEEINYVSNVLDAEPKIEMVLTHPKVTNNEKKELLDSLFKKNISQEMLNFLYVIIDKRRERYIKEISEYYDFLYNEEKNIVLATVVTAVPIGKAEEEKLKTTLTKKLNKDVQLKNVIDESIIGGVMLKVDNKVIDGSIKGQLDSMMKNLKAMRV